MCIYYTLRVLLLFRDLQYTLKVLVGKNVVQYELIFILYLHLVMPIGFNFATACVCLQALTVQCTIPTITQPLVTVVVIISSRDLFKT
jgi:hypothetical protein